MRAAPGALSLGRGLRGARLPGLQAPAGSWQATVVQAAGPVTMVTTAKTFPACCPLGACIDVAAWLPFWVWEMVEGGGRETPVTRTLPKPIPQPGILGRTFQKGATEQARETGEARCKG